MEYNLTVNISREILTYNYNAWDSPAWKEALEKHTNICINLDGIDNYMGTIYKKSNGYVYEMESRFCIRMLSSYIDLFIVNYCNNLALNKTRRKENNTLFANMYIKNRNEYLRLRNDLMALVPECRIYFRDNFGVWENDLSYIGNLGTIEKDNIYHKPFAKLEGLVGSKSMYFGMKLIGILDYIDSKEYELYYKWRPNALVYENLNEDQAMRIMRWKNGRSGKIDDVEEIVE